MATRVPSGSTAVCGTSACGRYSARNTPYGLASPGAVVSVQPGYEARASSTAAWEKARPARLASGSWMCTVSSGAGRLLGVRVGVVGAGQAPGESVRADGGLELRPDQCRLLPRCRVHTGRTTSCCGSRRAC